MRSTQLLNCIRTSGKVNLSMICLLMLIGGRVALAETVDWDPTIPYYQEVLQVPSGPIKNPLPVFTLRQKGDDTAVAKWGVRETDDHKLQLVYLDTLHPTDPPEVWTLGNKRTLVITLLRREHGIKIRTMEPNAAVVAKFPADEIEFIIPLAGATPAVDIPRVTYITAGLYIVGLGCVFTMLYTLQRRMKTVGITLKSDQEQLGKIHQQIISADIGSDRERLDEIFSKLTAIERGPDPVQDSQGRFERSTTALAQHTKDIGSYAAKIEVALSNRAKHATGDPASDTQEQVNVWIATVQQKTKNLDTVVARLNELLYGDVQRMADRPGFVTLQKNLAMTIETLHAILQKKEKQGMPSDLQQVYKKMQELLEPIHTQFDELFQMALIPHPEPQPNSDMRRRLEALENSLLEINLLLQTIHDILNPMPKPTSMPDDAEHDKEIISAASPPTSSQEQEISPVSVTASPLIMSEQRPEATEYPARKSAPAQSGSPAPSEAVGALSDSLAHDQVRPRSPSQTYDPSQWQSTIPMLLRQLEADDNTELNTILAQIKASFALLTDRWEDRYGAGTEPLGKLNGWSKSGVKELDRALYFVPKFDATSLPDPSRRIAVALFEAWAAAQKSRRKELRGRGIERIEVSSSVTQQKRDYVVAMDGVYIQTNDSSAVGKASHIEPGFGGYQINGETIHPTEAVFFIQAGGRG